MSHGFAFASVRFWRRLFQVPVSAATGLPEPRAHRRVAWRIQFWTVLVAILGALPGLAVAAVRSGGFGPLVRVVLAGDLSVLPPLFWLGGFAAMNVPLYFWAESFAASIPAVLTPRVSVARSVWLGVLWGIGAFVLVNALLLAAVSWLLSLLPGGVASFLAAPLFAARLVRDLFAGGLSTVEHALLFVVVCVGAPLWEELAFRRGFYECFLGKFQRQSLHRGLPPAAARRRAVLWSALIFAVLHLPAPLHLPRFLLAGVLFALVYERAGQLHAPVVAHAVFNLCGLLAIFVL